MPWGGENGWEQFVFLNRLNNLSFLQSCLHYLPSWPFIANSQTSSQALLLSLSISLLEWDVRTRAVFFLGAESASRSLLFGSCKNITVVPNCSCNKLPNWSLECPKFSSFHHFGGYSFINSVKELLDARYHTAAEIQTKPSPCCQMAYCFVGNTQYLYKYPKGHFCIVCSTNMESKMEADADGRLRLTYLVAK